MAVADEIAAVSPLADALLPMSATPLERAILTAELAAYARFNPEMIRWLIDPWRCPTAFLPFLAAAMSVDVWDDDWSEIEKRREIELSPRLHRLKGTEWAVETALARLGLPVEIVEWWEPYPARRRGTFRAILDVTGVDDTPALRAAAERRIWSTKPKSRVHELRISIGETGPLGIAAGTRSKTTLTAEPFVLGGDEENDGPLGIASAARTISTITAEPVSA